MNLKPLEDMQLRNMEGRKKHCYSSQADKLQKHGPINVLPLPWGGNDARDVVGAIDKSMIDIVYKYGLSLKRMGQ